MPASNRIRSLIAMAQETFDQERRKIGPYLQEKAVKALIDADGDREAARKLIMQWAKKDDHLWRALREPSEPRGYRPQLLETALLEVLQAPARWQLSQPVDPTLGRCPTCGEYRNRSEVRQVERDGCCIYACRVCGATINEADTVPF